MFLGHINGKSQYKKVNKGSMGNRELSRLSQRAIGSNGWVRKSLSNRLNIQIGVIPRQS